MISYANIRGFWCHTAYYSCRIFFCLLACAVSTEFFGSFQRNCESVVGLVEDFSRVATQDHHRKETKCQILILQCL